MFAFKTIRRHHTSGNLFEDVALNFSFKLSTTPPRRLPIGPPSLRPNGCAHITEEGVHCFSTSHTVHTPVCLVHFYTEIHHRSTDVHLYFTLCPNQVTFCLHGCLSLMKCHVPNSMLPQNHMSESAFYVKIIFREPKVYVRLESTRSF